MNFNKIILLTLIFPACALIQNCEKNELYPFDYYTCDLQFNDTSHLHPRAEIYQNILDENRKKGMVGAVLLVKDNDGLWMGASGKADIASNIDVMPCNTFLIASISKVFTATCIYRYIEKGILSMDDPINKWISHDITDKIKNGNEAQIKHLLSHTSGIVDYYTLKMELKRLNKVNNNWTKEDMLQFIYGKKPTNGVGETYYYTNTNFLLLSMILEKASGKSFKEIYQEEIFTPLQLHSAYYDEVNPIPEGCAKGYLDIFGKGKFVESRFLYEDELGIGGDGGIAINAYDLALFFEKLYKGDILTDNSYATMTNWFDIPEDWYWEEFGQTENGYGIEKFNTEYGYAIGHSGGVDGFISKIFYFPEHDITYVLLENSVSLNPDFKQDIFKSVMEEIFE